MGHPSPGASPIYDKVPFSKVTFHGRSSAIGPNYSTSEITYPWFTWHGLQLLPAVQHELKITGLMARGRNDNRNTRLIG